MDIKYNTLLGLAIASFEFLFGPLTYSLQIFVIFMVLDLISGTMDGLVNKSDKTSGGGISSRALYKGLVKKFSMLLCVAVAHMIGNYLGIENLRALVLDIMIAGEALSILENLALAGVPLPEKLVSVLETMKSDKERTYGDH